MGSDEEDRQRPTNEGLSQVLNNLSAQELTALFQKFSDADKKDLATAATQDLPDADKKDLATAATQALPTEDRMDIATVATQGLPPEEKKNIAISAVQTLPPEQKQEVQKAAGNPSQKVTDQIWLMVVGTFSAVLLISGIGLLYVAIWPPPGGSNSTQVLLPVFTSIAGILAGFISGRASAAAPSA